MDKKIKIQLFLAFVGSVLLKLILSNFVEAVDADSVSRINLSKYLSQDFKIISEGVWLPIHFYINALVMIITTKTATSLILFQILVSCLIIFPLFHFTKREFSLNAAWFTVGLFLLNPIIFRTSYLVLSEIPTLFFVTLSINELSKSLRFGKMKNAIYSGIFLTIATGLRYEPWILIVVFSLILFYHQEYKKMVAFGVIALIFPIYWMIGNFVAHDSFFYGVTGVYNSEIVSIQNLNISDSEYWKRALFFPFSILFSASPLLILFGLFILIYKQNWKKIKYLNFIWLTPVFILLLFFIYKSLNGTLLMQYRFSILLIIFVLPYLGFILSKIAIHLSKYVALLLLVFTPFTWLFLLFPTHIIFGTKSNPSIAINEIRLDAITSFNPIQKLQNQDIKIFERIANQNLKEMDGFIIDFVGWESTYYLLSVFEKENSNVMVLNFDTSNEVYQQDLSRFFTKNEDGILLIECYSKLYENIIIKDGELTILTGEKFYIEKIYQKETLMLLRYSKSKNFKSKMNLACPKENTVEWFIFKIKKDQIWCNNIKVNSYINGVSFESELRKNAEYMEMEAKKQ